MLLSLIGTINEWDTSVFLAVNGMHNAFWDVVMYWLSDKFIWIPLYFYFIYILFRDHKHRVWYILFAAIIMIIFSDQVSVNLFKNIFQRLRPCHEPSLQGMVHLVNNYCGGSYGFISSHACNNFALTTFLYGFLRPRYGKSVYLLFFWSGLICYSRVYLGAHYPGDVLVGALTGIIIGLGMRGFTFWFLTRLKRKPV